jgi:hypothetical protein
MTGLFGIRLMWLYVNIVRILCLWLPVSVDFPSYLSSITFIKNLEYRTATLTQVMVIAFKVQSMILFTMYSIFNQSTNVGYLALKVFTDNIIPVYILSQDRNAASNIFSQIGIFSKICMIET